MGARCWLLARSRGHAAQGLQQSPDLDEAATVEFVRSVYPHWRFREPEPTDLFDTAPGSGRLVAGVFDDLQMLAASELGQDRLSGLPKRLVVCNPGEQVCVHAMHSVVDWFGYALWEDGRLRRALSVSPDSGVMEDIGARLPFEEPFWAGEHPVADPDEPGGAGAYPLAFHPLELAEAALADRFGFVLEGYDGEPEGLVDPEAVPMLSLRRRRWWQLS